MSDTVIQVADLWKEFTIGAREKPSSFRELLQNVFTKPFIRRQSEARTQETFWALKGVEFEVRRGEVLGVIGRNGAGKSTLLKVLSRITEPTRGHIRMRGRLGSLLEVGTGFHPELTGRENVFLNGSILGLSKADIQRKFDEIVAFAEVDQFIDTPVKHYSSGMYLRLAFAVAAYLEPDILVVDEVLAVGDSAFQTRCISKMKDVATNDQRTVIFVSHNISAVKTICDNALLLRNGSVVDHGEADHVLRRYLQATLPNGHSRKWSPAEAPGNEEVQLLSVAATSPDGALTMSSAEDIVVYIGFTVSSEPKDLCIGFDLMCSDGSVLFRSYHTDMVSSMRPTPIRGYNSWRCSIPRGLLRQGTYYIAPRISSHRRYWIVQLPETIELTIVSDHGVSALWSAAERPGYIAPVLTWRQSNQPPETTECSDSTAVATHSLRHRGSTALD